MIERIDLVHVGEVQGIKVKWRELGWDALIGNSPEQNRRGTDGGRRPDEWRSGNLRALQFKTQGKACWSTKGERAHDTRIIEAVPGAHWIALPIQLGAFKSVVEIARHEDLMPTGGPIARLARLRPDIVEELMMGSSPGNV